jgi:hypothetical protein
MYKISEKKSSILLKKLLMSLNKILLTTLMTFGLLFSSTAQEKYTISGTISDQNSNETLYGVNIISTETKTGATTNEYGFYSISLPKGTYLIQISYVGFQTIEETIVLDKNIRKNFSLF